MKITNDANTTIIGSNTTVIIPNSDGVCAYVVVPVIVVRHIRLRKSATMH